MNYMSVFSEYIFGNLSADTARMKIESMLGDLQREGLSKEYARAVLCLTYFKRCQQHNFGDISNLDLLLFIRDFVLFIGRFRFPYQITEAVRKYGQKVGLYLTPDEETYVLEEYPESVTRREHFIREVYTLNSDKIQFGGTSRGDGLLHQHTIFKSYRSLEQKTAAHCAVDLPDDYTLMISLPTGGGKSLITQLLAANEDKLTIVIVPTVALAQDQKYQAENCIAMENKKEKIWCFVGGENHEPVLKAIKERKARLIFSSPEALMKNHAFHKAILEAAENHYLHNIVIDEAHIVPDWGINFRPEFQIFSVMLEKMKEISCHYLRTYLLSATLSDDTVQVLRELFSTEGKFAELRCDALRPEPRYIFASYHDYLKRQDEVLKLAFTMPKPMIIYVTKPKTANDYCKLLKDKGLKNVFSYTGKTPDAKREELLKNWKEDEYDIIVATSAFGIGVDKKDVRTVIHACAPENLSRFYQEVGRGGRDGLPSLSILVNYTSKEKNNDLDEAFGLIKKNILRAGNIKKRFESILRDEANIVEGNRISADLNTVPESFTEEEKERAGEQNMTWNVNMLLLLRRQNYIRIMDAFYDSAASTYRFDFEINNIALFQDEEKLIKELEEGRDREYEMRKKGYNKIKELIQKPEGKCWGRNFVSLYPLAVPLCNGCPVHEHPVTGIETGFKIRNKCDIKVSAGEPSRLLRRKCSIYNDMIIPWESGRTPELKELIRVGEKLGLAAVVYPEIISEEFDSSIMILQWKEFSTMAESAPWLFKNGILLLMSMNDEANDRMYRFLLKDPICNYKKIWSCRQDIYIKSEEKPFHEFLNCRICDMNELKGE